MDDILIRGMDMPGDCASCPFCVVFPKKQLGMCVAFGDGTNREKMNGRMENCPLHELPPHGDLIDIRTVLEIVMQYVPDDDGSCSKAKADLLELLDAIENAPVVVPAERSGE